MEVEGMMHMDIVNGFAPELMSNFLSFLDCDDIIRLLWTESSSGARFFGLAGAWAWADRDHSWEHSVIMDMASEPMLSLSKAAAVLSDWVTLTSMSLPSSYVKVYVWSFLRKAAVQNTLKWQPWLCPREQLDRVR